MSTLSTDESFVRTSRVQCRILSLDAEIIEKLHSYLCILISIEVCEGVLRLSTT